MASSSRFADPVTDAKEKEIRSKALPDKTKATTDWGMKAWTDWACSRLISPADVVSRVLPTNTKEMTLYHHNFSDQLIKERTGHRS